MTTSQAEMLALMTGFSCMNSIEFSAIVSYSFALNSARVSTVSTFFCLLGGNLTSVVNPDNRQERGLVLVQQSSICVAICSKVDDDNFSPARTLTACSKLLLST